ncbi:hypothetical protein GX586_15430, partial [bacterium]|nr:hypothetical protein [bacterium]
NGESFSKQVIDYGPIGAAKGCGIAFHPIDLRGTGRIDLVLPGKDGLWVFYNEGVWREGRERQLRKSRCNASSSRPWWVRSARFSEAVHLAHAHAAGSAALDMRNATLVDCPA